MVRVETNCSRLASKVSTHCRLTDAACCTTRAAKCSTHTIARATAVYPQLIERDATEKSLPSITRESDRPSLSTSGHWSRSSVSKGCRPDAAQRSAPHSSLRVQKLAQRLRRQARRRPVAPAWRAAPGILRSPEQLAKPRWTWAPRALTAGAAPKERAPMQPQRSGASSVHPRAPH